MTKDELVTVQMVPLAAIVSNHFRRADFTLSESKIESLIQSYATSGFWDGSIQARPHPMERGLFEIAFGHHRVEAAKRAQIDPIGLAVKDRSDADMLRMMADENREEFSADAYVAVETIAAVLEAYDRGEIGLEAIDPKDRSQRFAFPGGNAKEYTLATVARFLGWVKPSTGQANRACRAAFDAYQMRASTDAALKSIPSGQRSEVAVGVVMTAATVARNTAQKQHLPPAKVREAEQIAATMAAAEVIEHSGFKARDGAALIGHKAVAKVQKKKPKSGPPVEVYIGRLVRKCQTTNPYQQILEQCGQLTPFVADIDKAHTHRLADALEEMLTRSTRAVHDLVRALRSNHPDRVRKALERKALEA